MRGADKSDCGGSQRYVGSSPHAWGRCIPLRPSAVSLSVHPHMRGADVTDRHHHDGTMAVHPHMRGADDCSLSLDALLGRFIPTCVGQMRNKMILSREAIRFIPTCVGQIKRQVFLSFQDFGSSPHAWGRFR